LQNKVIFISALSWRRFDTRYIRTRFFDSGAGIGRVVFVAVYNKWYMKSLENPLVKSEKSNIEGEREKTFFERQRQSLGIPTSLNESPVLYMSAHRGVFNAEFEGHRAEFQKVMVGGEISTDDKESVYIDLSKSNPEEVVELLWYMVQKTDPSREQGILPSPSGQNEALPGFLSNIIFLPALDQNGGSASKEPSHTFAIDRHNYQVLLPRLGEFLKEKGIVGQPDKQIIGQVGEDPRKIIE